MSRAELVCNEAFVTPARYYLEMEVGGESKDAFLEGKDKEKHVVM